MGKHSRRKQERLAEKLVQIRVALNLSQNGMLKHLGLNEEMPRTSISNYELGVREPPLFVLLQYAQAAGVSTDVLIDDALDLPAKLPSIPKHEKVRLKLKSNVKRD